ncbi:hypothetical protein CAEBREN_13974 [Caenorhabditis brenneri]|uniref:Uncharacterized protein n=1 Tax=Caenorhabditis brenneri TaxID=135651 RepID=G0NGB4_CAEBE|nr:hypothetical protein CAEBREN_13974 [Caenorhabditis brenneri]
MSFDDDMVLKEVGPVYAGVIDYQATNQKQGYWLKNLFGTRFNAEFVGFLMFDQIIHLPRTASPGIEKYQLYEILVDLPFQEEPEIPEGEDEEVILPDIKEVMEDFEDGVEPMEVD